MKWHRWIIWTQAILAAATLLASLSERYLAPRILWPILAPVALIAFFAIPVLPLGVVVILWKSEDTKARKFYTFIATSLLAAITFYCFIPLVQ